MDENTLFWLFSTIAQTYGAIVSIIGFLVIYRLDRFNKYLEEDKKTYKRNFDSFFRNYRTGLDVNALKTEDIVNNWNEIVVGNDLKKKDLKGNYGVAYKGIIGMKRNLNWSRAVRIVFGIVILYHLPLIIFSIIGIYYVPELTQYAEIIPCNLIIVLLLSLGLIFLLLYFLISDKPIKWYEIVFEKFSSLKKKKRR